MRKLSLFGITSIFAISLALNAAASADVDSLLERGESLRKKADFAGAQKSIEQAIAILDLAEQKDLARLSAAYNYLSLNENNAGNYVAAEKHARRAIDLAREAKLGQDAIAMHSVVLANALRQQGKYFEAEKLLQIALPVLDKPSTNQSLLGTAQNNLGAIYFWLGHYEEAIPLLQKGLDTRLKALGAEHVDVANSYLDLGATEFKIGNTDKAVQYLSESVRIRKKMLGEKHPETLASEATLAVIFESQGKTPQASMLLEKVVSLARKSLGPRHPDLAQYEDDYANVLASQKLFDKARRMQTNAMMIRKERFGPASRDYAASLRSLAQIESASGAKAKAGSLLQQSADVYKKAGQAADPDYADTLDELAAHFVGIGDLDSARKSFAESVSIRQNAGPTVAAAVSLANLADVLARMNRQAESMEALRKSKTVIEALPEPLKANPDCAAILERINRLNQ